MFCEKTIIEDCYSEILDFYDENTDYEDLKRFISSFIDEISANYTSTDFKQIVELYYTHEELLEFGELTDVIYKNIAYDNILSKKIAHKIYYGFIEMTYSIGDTIDDDISETNNDVEVINNMAEFFEFGNWDV